MLTRDAMNIVMNAIMNAQAHDLKIGCVKKKALRINPAIDPNINVLDNGATLNILNHLF
ncbi:hypothetical protein HQ533_00225 [Candidatus Woesearchaeota archaeon]|nr:hypothetical protein [Candidatus Woesearchaeota archaeon]